jgi:ABC-type bacteriocin/lantibiotic exporter with double-glycine peptidase domain
VNINTKNIKVNSVLQHDSSDCGAACLVTVIRYFGGNSTIEKIRNLSGTSQSGTTMLGLYQAAKESGLDATGYEATINDLKEFNNVLILHVTPEERLDHYIVNFGVDKGKFIIWDPSKGLTDMSEDELGKIWLSRKCLGVLPNETFRLEKEINRGKKEWLIKSIKPEKDLLIISIITGILISGLGLVMAVFTQKLIDKILPSKEIKVLILASVLVIILLSTRIVLSYIRQYFLLLQGKSFNIRIVDEFYSALLFLPKQFFDTRKTGDFVARLNDTMRIQRVIAEFVGVYIIDVLILLITTIALFYYSEIAAFLSLICLPLFYFIVYRWNKRIVSAQHNVMAGYALSDSNFINSLRGILEIKSLNWQHDFSVKNKFIYSEFQERFYLLEKIKIKLNLMTAMAGTVYIMIILIYSSVRVMSTGMTQGELMAILSLSSTLLPSVLNLALIGIPLSEAKVALNRMFEFSQIDPEEKKSSDQEKLEIQKLSLENISFRFPGQKLLLDNINLTIEKGKVISLVGESGCGKSTLASIIMRFYLPESGRLIVNGDLDSDGVNLENWRAKIGIIPQEIHIFNGTILQNLLTDLTESKINGMISTISDFGLSGFINSFPSGLMTLVGEEGINLSGGQKQLLAFIRVLLSKPDILIIDEGTSNMDRCTESMIMNLISTLRERMGILLISHRINMIKNLSDRIYVIDGKVLTCNGTHSDLIKSDNLYKRFWDDFY